MILLIELGIDEITLVLQIPPHQKANINIFDWENIANNLIGIFEEKAEFKKIFGERNTLIRAPEGYTNAFSYGEHNFNFAVAYHPHHLRMGIIIKFSAQSLDYYCEQSGLEVYEFLQKVREDSIYILRLSRVDVVADYIDEDIDITNIYNDLNERKVGVFYERANKKTNEIIFTERPLKQSSIAKGKNVETLYIGSPKSNARLRIYNKKQEQIEKNGNHFQKAIQTQNWTRMECILRNEYAHQLTDELLGITSNDEYANLIACVLLQKFRFMYINDLGKADCETEYTQLLIECISNKNFVLKAPCSRNYEMAKALKYIFYGSGVMSTLFKIQDIWGDEAISLLLDFIKEALLEWEPNEDCRYWLSKNKSDYQLNHKNFDLYLRENLITQL